MKYWLLKTEPDEWSWKDQVKESKGGAIWDGVRNFQARNNLKGMGICLLYTSPSPRDLSTSRMPSSA